MSAMHGRGDAVESTMHGGEASVPENSVALLRFMLQYLMAAVDSYALREAAPDGKPSETMPS